LLQARSLTAPAALIERGYKGRVDPNAICASGRCAGA
jgi:hypothetical protein